MGTRGEDAQALTGEPPQATARRTWPLVVRRARPEDRNAILSFASDTWHGWDYIPNAWPVWIDATDGVFLVGEIGRPPPGVEEPVDAEGNPLEVGLPVAITRVAMVSDSEAWLEGIRVDPHVRGMGVAADLQIAELQWVAAQEARIVRYATGSTNEASHRLGARDDITLVARLRSLWFSEDPDADADPASAFDPDVRQAATSRRQELLAKLANEGWIADAAIGRKLWSLVSADPGFNAARRLYEPRAWALNELTENVFGRHVERGEVVTAPGTSGPADWAVAVIPSVQLPAEDSALRAALLAGTPDRVIELSENVRRVSGEPVRFRVAADSPLFAEHLDRLAESGYRAAKYAMHVLARPMDAGHPVPEPDPSRIVFGDPPVADLTPPTW